MTKQSVDDRWDAEFGATPTRPVDLQTVQDDRKCLSLTAFLFFAVDFILWLLFIIFTFVQPGFFNTKPEWWGEDTPWNNASHPERHLQQILYVNWLVWGTFAIPGVVNLYFFLGWLKLKTDQTLGWFTLVSPLVIGLLFTIILTAFWGHLIRATEMFVNEDCTPRIQKPEDVVPDFIVVPAHLVKYCKLERPYVDYVCIDGRQTDGWRVAFVVLGLISFLIFLLVASWIHHVGRQRILERIRLAMRA